MEHDPREQPKVDFPRAIGMPATNALAVAGYHQLAQLTSMSANALGELHGVGPKAIGILRAALKEQGLSFADE